MKIKVTVLLDDEQMAAQDKPRLLQDIEFAVEGILNQTRDGPDRRGSTINFEIDVEIEQ